MEQVFDFRQEADVAGDVSVEIEYLDTQQLVKVHNYIQDLQKETEKNNLEDALDWFNQVILPSLKALAQKNDAKLEIRSDGGIILATISNDCGIDIDSGEQRMRMLVNQANHFSIERNETDCVLFLYFWPPRFFWVISCWRHPVLTTT